MASVEFIGATRTYPKQKRPAVDALSLKVKDGEFVTVVGPSGSGKSTTLRMLAGLEPCDLGRVHIGERDVTVAQTRERNVAMVFQTFALYPHMTVAENMAFALKLGGASKEKIEERVLAAAAMLNLSDVLHRLPKTLSGGQRQRVAMGRAVVREPDVFLLDEPLSNLDVPLRQQMRTEIMQLQHRLNATMMYVTHDQTEALTMGHRVAVMNEGVLQQFATPSEIYDQPQSLFVAKFVGSPSMNIWEVDAHGQTAHLGGQQLALPPARELDATRRVVVGARPEDVVIDDAAPIRGLVRRIEVPGADTLIYLDIMNSNGHTATARLAARSAIAPGDEVGIAISPARMHIFDAASGARLN